MRLSVGGYGDKGRTAIRNFVYGPAMGSQEGYTIMMDRLSESRKKRGEDGNAEYTGTYQELDGLNDALKIVRENFTNITIGDLLDILKYENKDLKNKYGHIYLYALQEGNERDKKMF